MGMAPLAAWMHEAGYRVTGCDDHLQEMVRRFLADRGVECFECLFPEQLADYDTLVFSSAVREDHPLRAEATQRGLACIRRGELLAAIASDKQLVAVVGSHGKTTTTAMIAHAVHCCDLPVDYILGGFFNGNAVPPCRSTGQRRLVAEIDESDGTIEHFSPQMTLALNFDWDHADHYADEASLRQVFTRLFEKTEETILVPQEGGLDALLPRDLGATVHRFATGDGTAVVPGASSASTGGAPFNRLNRQAAAAVLERIRMDAPSSAASGFPGVQRRQTVLLESSGLRVLEDYAHHPTEIRALLAALRQEAEGPLTVVFQPHRYSRTLRFKEAFASALGGADSVFLLPVYSAFEAPLAGGTLEDLRRSFPGRFPEVLEMHLGGMRRLEASVEAAGGTLAFVGAGDLDQFAHGFTAWFRARDGEGSAAGATRRVDRAWLTFLKGKVSGEAHLALAEPLAKKTTMRVGGAARFYAEPATVCDLRAVIRSARLFGLPWFFLGRGSNLLVPDDGFDGLVIRLSKPFWREIRILDGDKIWVGAGVRLKEICGTAARAGLSGFEFLEGIPGSVGGALRMNAGAMGGWMFDIVDRVRLMDASGRITDRPRRFFHFGYRKVEEISEGVALGAVLRSPEAMESDAIRQQIDTYATTRKASQPREPSAGCIFKNPEGAYAGQLIEASGLKGRRIGGAEVSERHGNFIVNRGTATAGDVIELVRSVRAEVKAHSGHELEPEVLLLGGSWEDTLGGAPQQTSTKQ